MKLLSVIIILYLSMSCKKPETNALTTHSAKTLFIAKPQDFFEKLSNAAIAILDPDVVYTPNYIGIKYPNGDVPPKTGVCTDVVIRAYRKLGIDLQKEVHEDMVANFHLYPNLSKWGLKSTDTNIDHRRVPNLEVFFERKGKKITCFTKPFGL